MFARRIVLAALALALALPASAPARRSARLSAPTGLKAFALRYDEPASHNFARTPSFAWTPIKRTTNYEFQLATSEDFRENSILWSTTSLTPYASVPLSLPWVTGHPYSLFARVRARTQTGLTAWSDDFGFNVRWTQLPAQLPAPNGLLRWSPVDGASAYQVWEMGITGSGALLWSSAKCKGDHGTVYGKCYLVATNAADMRDWFTFHSDASWVTTARWRVRAVRMTYGTTQNTQTSTSYGPWSPVFTTTANPPSSGTVNVDSTVSDGIGTPTSPYPHSLMPGFSWTGNQSAAGETTELYRAYVFSDGDCVDPVLIGSIVGSPAWVPRLSGALILPQNAVDLAQARGGVLKDGSQGITYDYAFEELLPNETGTAADRLDVWDRKWPSGVYYWTVVPVHWSIDLDGRIEYQDTEVPQDACAAGRVETFGRVSAPIPSDSAASYVTSLSATGDLLTFSASSSPRVYGSPMVTWTPVPGAEEFEVQWSSTRYPFQALGNVISPGITAVLALPPGTWYYRVRGIDLQIPGAQAMAWSNIRKLVIAKRVFRVSR